MSPAPSGEIHVLTTAAVAECPSDFAPAREISRLTGLSVRRVRELSELGYIGIMSPLPGMQGIVRYSRRDALALLQAMIKPASRLDQILGTAPAARELASA
jgi:hypothetical protein